jgi:UDP-glucuronate decarboxylase
MQPDDGRVVSNLIVQALRGEPVTLFGSPTQSRSFCYVSDMVDGLVCLMASPEAFTGPVNLGNPTEISIRALAEKVIGLTASRSTLTFLPLPADDPRRRCPDIGLARATLDRSPKVELDEGLAATIAYFRAL